MKPHGLKGEVTISLNPDSPANWADLNVLYADKNGTLIPYFIERISVRGDKAIVKFEDVSQLEDASSLKSVSFFLPKNSRPVIDPNSFYDDEVIDYQVIDDNVGALGLVSDIERAGMNRYLILIYHDKEIMIPAQAPFLKKIDKTKKEITVMLPDGFLDI